MVWFLFKILTLVTYWIAEESNFRSGCKISDGSVGRAAVPSGASTGKYEAYELRDKKVIFTMDMV